MSTTLERLAAEVRRLSPTEIIELRAWIMEYQLPHNAGVNGQPHVDWSNHAARVQAIFEPASPPKQNPVLALRAEERF